MYKYGWKPQKKDPKDYLYMKAYWGQKFAPIIECIDPTPVLDQGALGSCTANGIAGLIAYELVVNCGLPYWLASRLAIYWLERYQEGNVNEDSGAEIRDGIKVTNLWGIADESLCPYNIADFTKKPSQEYFAKAQTDKLKYYAAVDCSNVANIKLAISHGHGVVFGTNLYGAFENYTEGVIQVPAQDDQLLGGHCMWMKGWDDSINAMYVKNSWNESWGQKGHVWFSYDYVEKYFSDAWVIRLK